MASITELAAKLKEIHAEFIKHSEVFDKITNDAKVKFDTACTIAKLEYDAAYRAAYSQQYIEACDNYDAAYEEFNNALKSAAHEEFDNTTYMNY